MITIDEHQDTDPSRLRVAQNKVLNNLLHTPPGCERYTHGKRNKRLETGVNSTNIQSRSGHEESGWVLPSGTSDINVRDRPVTLPPVNASMFITLQPFVCPLLVLVFILPRRSPVTRQVKPMLS